MRHTVDASFFNEGDEYWTCSPANGELLITRSCWDEESEVQQRLRPRDLYIDLATALVHTIRIGVDKVLVSDYRLDGMYELTIKPRQR